MSRLFLGSREVTPVVGSSGGISPVLSNFPITNCNLANGLKVNQNGEISGFYAISSHYPTEGIFIPNISNAEMTSFEIDFSFMKKENSDYPEDEFGALVIWSSVSTPERSLLIDIYENNIKCYYSYNGTNWETPLGSVNISNNIKYFSKVEVANSVLTFSLSENGTTYTDYTVSLSQSLKGGIVEFGNSACDLTNPAKDIIYINDIKMYKNEVLVFQGATL